MPRRPVRDRYEPVFDFGDERCNLPLDRANAGLTVTELARRCGCSRSRIWSWETGHERIAPKWYPRIIAALDGEGG